MTIRLRATRLAAHLRRGQDAERAARRYLESRGLSMIARNYRCARGELDLVMRVGRELVFVEVRYRASHQFGGAARSVDAPKQQKLRVAAEMFLQENAKLAFDTCRFDVIALTGAPPDYRIDWIDNAF